MNMKTTLLFVAITAWTLSSVTPAYAQDKAAPASAQDKAVPATPAMSTEMDAQVSRMRENMSAAQQQMEKFRTTTDSKGRQQLMQEHMQTMQDSMTLMHDMKGPMMMGGAQQGGMQMQPGRNMAGGEKMQNRDMMQGQRQGHMQMMQMMLELMVQQDQMMMESIPTR
ncbi:MAG: hypothetical protein MUO39_07080 [Steroidobacteraceae bacterium]|nr:hypothetical protein [Steroidobacteraceae bacterium]